ncbi:MAG: alpha/beta fold hydrolase [Deltaproteobacteria bacterium]|nr:alpha/beta fold hydrolase [Deltaproteobacteria bacterium]
MTQFSKACLVVHGLTGTPQNMGPLITALEKAGYRVKAPLLNGHGEGLKKLAETPWQEWYGLIARCHNELKRDSKKVFFAGLSMGSLLGLKLAEEVGNDLDGLALLGVPWKLKPLFKYLVIPGIRYTPLRWIIRSTAKNFEKSVIDPQGRELYRSHSLARMPGTAVFQMMDMLSIVKKELAKVTQPLLMIHGAKDHLADPKGMLEIRNGVSSKKVEIVMMENSAHVLTVDYDKEAVVKKVVTFFDSLSTAEHNR